MKKILLATTVLVGFAGAAAAEVTLSGDARMGVTNNTAIGGGEGDTAFSSRARVKFSASVESDGGLTFAAQFRAGDAVAAAGGTAGTVSVSGAFGTLSMGDNDSAAQAGVGQVAGVGYTGLGDHNEITYLGDDSPSALYTYAAGSLTVMASVGQISGESQTSLAAAYTMGDYTVAAGIESHDDVEDTHVVIGGSAKFGAVSVKAVYGQLGDLDQYALSATYTADALSVTAFHNMALFTDDVANGVGVSYDLGGGAAFSAGYTQADEAGDLFDAGVSFSF